MAAFGNGVGFEQVCVVSDFSSDPIKAKIAGVEKTKIHPALRDSSSADATWTRE